MPNTKKNIKKNKRTSFKKQNKRSFAPQRQAISKSFGGDFSKYLRPTPFPVRMRVWMDYSQTFTLTASAINTFGSEQAFRLNSPYQPLFSGSNRPHGWTQMAALYASYRVFKVRMQITFSNPSEAAGVGMICGCMVQQSQGTSTLAGLSYTTADYLSGVAIKFLNNTGSQQVTFRKTFTIPQLETMRFQQWIADIDYVGNAGASPNNPAATPFLRVACCNDATLTATTCSVFVRLAYDTEFYNRIDVA